MSAHRKGSLAELAAMLEPGIKQPSRADRQQLKRCVSVAVTEPLVAAIMMKVGPRRRSALWFGGSGTDSRAAREAILLSVSARDEIIVTGGAKIANRLVLADIFLSDSCESNAHETSPRMVMRAAASRVALKLCQQSGPRFADREFVDVTVRAWAEQLAACAVREWAESLDLPALEFGRKVEAEGHATGVAIYNFIMHQSNHGEDSNASRNRRQLIASNSFLSQACLRTFMKGATRGDLEAILLAIDRGVSLRQVAKDAWNILPRTASWLVASRPASTASSPGAQDVAGEDLAPLDLADLSNIVHQLDGFPSEYLPKNPIELQWAHCLLTIYPDGPGGLARRLGIHAFELLRLELKTGWSTLGSSYPWRELRARIRDAMDAFQLIRGVFEFWGSSQQLDVRHDVDTMLQELFSRKPLSALLRLTEEVHGILLFASIEAQAELARIEAELKQLNEWGALSWETTFPPLLNAALARNGVHFVELTTLEGLLQEGREMGHCVGTYGRNCASGKHRIFRLDRDGERATLSIRIPRHTFTVEQVRGKGNSEVSQQIQDAVNAVLVDLNSGAITNNRELIADRRRDNRHRDTERLQMYDRILWRRLDASLVSLLPTSIRSASFSASLWEMVRKRKS